MNFQLYSFSKTMTTCEIIPVISLDCVGMVSKQIHEHEDVERKSRRVLLRRDASENASCNRIHLLTYDQILYQIYWFQSQSNYWTQKMLCSIKYYLVLDPFRVWEGGINTVYLKCVLSSFRRIWIITVNSSSLEAQCFVIFLFPPSKKIF